MSFSEFSHLVRGLYQITSQYDQGFERQTLEMLKLGCTLFKLEIGIIANIDGDDFTIVQNISPPELGITNNRVYQFKRTYCELTIKQDKVFTETHFKNSGYSSHPGYIDFQLESYMGVPIYVDEKLFGTLSFSSPSSRQQDFSEIEMDTIQLMSNWIGAELSRRNKERLLLELNEKLLSLSITDGLTQINNRLFFQTELERQMSFAQRSGTPLSLLILDIDYFKKFNDSFGHLEGDKALIQTAKIMSENSRNYDIVARFGGEEFAIILPNTDKTGALRHAEKIRRAFEQATWQHREIRVSIGIETFTETAQNEDTKKLVTKIISHADKALYASKENGRNRSTHYSDLLTSQ